MHVPVVFIRLDMAVSLAELGIDKFDLSGLIVKKLAQAGKSRISSDNCISLY